MFVSHTFGDQPRSSHAVSPSIIYLGLDVHKDSVTLAVLPADASAPTRIDKHPNDFAKLRRVFERHAKDGRLGRATKPAVRGMCCSAPCRDGDSIAT